MLYDGVRPEDYGPAQQSIADALKNVKLIHGTGSKTPTVHQKIETCTIGAIWMALRGEISDSHMNCLSPAVRRWAITIQDGLPLDMMQPDDEHGHRWREAIPLIAGSIELDRSAQARVAVEAMWRALGDQAAPDWVPFAARDLWEKALRARVPFSPDILQLWAFPETDAMPYSILKQLLNHLMSVDELQQRTVEGNPVFNSDMAAGAASVVRCLADLMNITTAYDRDTVYKFWATVDPATTLREMCTVEPRTS